MFASEYKIKFNDVDAAGLMYYPRYFSICHEVFENLFNNFYHLNYSDLILKHKIGFPVVSISSNFILPVCYSDSIKIILEVIKIKKSSFIKSYNFLKQEKLIFESTIICACTNLITKKSQVLEYELKKFLGNYLV